MNKLYRSAFSMASVDSSSAPVDVSTGVVEGSAMQAFARNVLVTLYNSYAPKMTGVAVLNSLNLLTV